MVFDRDVSHILVNFLVTCVSNIKFDLITDCMEGLAVVRGVV